MFINYQIIWFYRLSFEFDSGLHLPNDGQTETKNCHLHKFRNKCCRKKTSEYNQFASITEWTSMKYESENKQKAPSIFFLQIIAILVVEKCFDFQVVSVGLICIHHYFCYQIDFVKTMKWSLRWESNSPLWLKKNTSRQCALVHTIELIDKSNRKATDIQPRNQITSRY